MSRPDPNTGPRHEPERIYERASDPYRPPSPDDDPDRASGTRGSGQGAEESR